MSSTLLESTQLIVKEVVIVTKGGPVNITALYDEINIHDSLFLPVVSGNILITDAIGLSGRLDFDGSEVIAIHVEKMADSTIASFKKSFRIYKQTERRNVNQSTEKYILHFVSDELIFSDQQRINQSYETTYGKVVQKILSDYLQIYDKDKGLYEDTSGIKKIVIPNLRPLEAIEWCAKRAVDTKNSPNYIFYCNSLGYNFVTLSTLVSKNPILDINFSPKNLTDKGPLDEMSGARSFEVLVQNDLIDKIRSGVGAGKFIGFDPLTRTFGEKPLNFKSHYDTLTHANKNQNITEVFNRDNTTNLTTINSRKVLSIYGPKRKESAYIKKYDPSSISKVEDYENFAFQRKAIFKNLVARRLKIVMPGNFQLTSGFNVTFNTSGFSDKSKNVEDNSINGKYLIVATRQIIKNNKHETIIEVVTDSTNEATSYTSSQQQNQTLKGY
jgi:hypothetical protein